MKITKITIKNFRSIQNAEIHCKDFNVFVGQNNAGKTNLFEAVDWFFNPGSSKSVSMHEIAFNQDNSVIVEVEIEFSGIQEGILRMKNEKNAKSLKNMLGEIDCASVRRASNDPNKRKIIVNGEEQKNVLGIDVLNDLLPKFEYIHTRQYYDAVAKFGKSTPIGVMLSGVLAAILETSIEYRDFKSKFQELFGGEASEVKIEFDRLAGRVQVNLGRQFPDCTKVTFEVAPPVFEDLLKNFDTKVHDGVETTAAEKGDGMQRALMLAIIQAYAEYRRQNEDLGKSFLFFIDEAELHLHPTAQRKLKTVLLELSQASDQVFINTHSSVLVVDEHEQQQLFKVEKIDSQTLISKIDEADKPYVIYELLGGSPADLLLPDNFMIVEGRSEWEFLTRVIKRHYPEKPRIQITPAGGDTDQADRTINAIEQLFSPLNKSLYGKKLVILCDKPSVKKDLAVKDFLNKYKDLRRSGQIFFLPCSSLEECYPIGSEWHRTADQEDAMKAEKKRKLAIRAGDAISKEQFETEMPKVFQALEKCWENALSNH